MTLTACGDDEDGMTTSASQGGATSAAQQSDLPDRGTVSPQSSDFEKYSAGGKLHLAEFGEEAEEGDRAAAEESVVGYLQAISQGEWESACSYLLPEAEVQLAQFAPQAAPGDCARALPVAVRKLSPDGEPALAPEGVASLRMTEGGRADDGAGFALFHGSDGEDHWMALRSEGGSWGILSVVPQPFA